MNTQPGFLPHPPAMPSPFSAPHQVFASKMMPYLGYPGIPMWQFVPPAAVDTSEDHSLRPPISTAPKLVMRRVLKAITMPTENTIRDALP
ncbi:hypothetical protein H5410_008012 [Solanum commersonii]|uniref:Uncharacterized protein n=1 Tax=Solanum commersonii TaxID=4109 RepID=A0A9J6AF99_SOLCO|nr:hypothetical protein H5410_008012 [Solanum commersonii]